MRNPIIVVLLLVGMCSCGSVPPEGSLERIKRDQRMQLNQQCRETPDRYGFAYTQEEYMNARFHVAPWVPDLSDYCLRVSRKLVR